MKLLIIIALLMSRLLAFETVDANSSLKDSLKLFKNLLDEENIDKFLEIAKPYMDDINSSLNNEQTESFVATSKERVSNYAAEALIRLYCSKSDSLGQKKQRIYHLMLRVQRELPIGLKL